MIGKSRRRPHTSCWKNQDGRVYITGQIMYTSISREPSRSARPRRWHSIQGKRRFLRAHTPMGHRARKQSKATLPWQRANQGNSMNKV